MIKAVNRLGSPFDAADDVDGADGVDVGDADGDATLPVVEVEEPRAFASAREERELAEAV
ncbi:hypothetical protein ACQPW3_25215 [Actinosynnema sp. CA-248983]